MPEKTVNAKKYLDSLSPRVRKKFDELSALKKPGVEVGEVFHSLHEMALDASLAASHQQKHLLLNHELAKTAWEDFQATGKIVTMGEVMPVGRRTNLEFCAEYSAMDALRQAIKYYSQHGRITQAFTELRELAEKHWHPSIQKNFETYFRRQAEKAGVELPASLKLHLEKAKQEEREGRFKEYGRRLKVQEGFKKTGRKPD